MCAWINCYVLLNINIKLSKQNSVDFDTAKRTFLMEFKFIQYDG